MTNKDIFQTIGASKENFRMTEAESQNIKAALMAHMKANPVQQKSNFFASLMRPMRMAVSALSVVLVAGVGVSYAAEASLPGDLLYPVKVNVMEEVVSSLKINKEAKAEYEVQRAGKRFDEAMQLVESGGLTPELEAKVWGHLEQQAVKVEGLAVELEVNENEKSQNIRSNWNKLIVENEAIVVQLVMEEPPVQEQTEPELIEAIEPVETQETPVVETIPPVIEVLPAVLTEPAITEPIVEVEPSVEVMIEQPEIETIPPVIEVLPQIEVLPAVVTEPVVEEPVIEEPVLDVTTVLDPVIEEEVVTVEITNPALETDSTVIVAPVVEAVEEETLELEVSPVLIDSGLILDSSTRLQLQLNRRR